MNTSRQRRRRVLIGIAIAALAVRPGQNGQAVAIA